MNTDDQVTLDRLAKRIRRRKYVESITPEEWRQYAAKYTADGHPEPARTCEEAADKRECGFGWGGETI